MEMKKREPLTGSNRNCTDPCKDNGGWINIPHNDKGYRNIGRFSPVVGDRGFILMKADDDEYKYCVEIYCPQGACLIVLFSEDYESCVENVRNLKFI